MIHEGFKSIRVVTWNVNSLRKRLEGVRRLVELHSPDVMCFQETKVRDSEFPMGALKMLGYEYSVYRGIPKHNGVAIVSRLCIERGDVHNFCGRDDGRYVWADIGGIRFHNVYVPSGGRVACMDSEKFSHKMEFVKEMEDYFAWVGEGEDVLCGDLNIAPKAEDVFDHEVMKKIVSHTEGEVESLERLQERGCFRDCIREGYGEGVKLSSWWSYRSRDWEETDRGLRLDHMWMRSGLERVRVEGVESVREARNWDLPSDHVPLMMDISF